MEDRHILAMRAYMFKEFDQVSFAGNDMMDAMTYEATLNTYNPAKDYFDDLPAWDNHKRAETIFIDNQGVEDTAVHRMITRKWLLAIIYRVYHPGYKFDHALFLTGNEGTGKSSMFTALATRRDWFAELITTRPDKVEECTKGTIIVELAEGIVMHKSKAEEVKHMISNNQTRQRLAYGHLPKTFKPTSVFCGSTNKHDFLMGEQNGVRRIWPLRTTRESNDVYDYKQFINDIPQIYAEIKTWYTNKEELTIPSELEAELFKVREAIIAEDEWTQEIKNFIDGNSKSNDKVSDELGQLDRVCIKIICENILNSDYATFTKDTRSQNRVSAIMNRFKNWEHNGKKAMRMPIGNVAKGWRRLDTTKDSDGNEVEDE